MHKILKNFENALIIENQSILNGLKKIDKGKIRLGFIVNKKKCLQKVVSDGDIRRALLKGFSLKDKIIKIHNRKPVFVYEKDIKIITEKDFPSGISYLPVLNDKNQILGILTKNNKDPLSINIKEKKITVFGLGYVGLTLALKLAQRGFQVFGYDKNRSLLNSIRKKKPTFFENGIQDYLNNYVGKNLNIIDKLNNHESDIYIVTVGTPLKKNSKSPDIDHAKKAIEAISKKLKKGDLIILRSTLPVGFTRKIAIKIIEKLSNFKISKDISLAVCPERTAEGKALVELDTLPQIVGAADDLSYELASRLFNINTHTVIDVGDTDSAEMCKILDNTFRDTIFAFSNQMALYCEKSNLNLKRLIDSVNLGYSRNFIPYPSPGVGGPCLSKDPYILIDNLKRMRVNSDLILSARKINEYAPINIFNLIEKFKKNFKKKQNLKIFVMGLAFKGSPETSDLRDSTSLNIIDKLSKKYKNIYLYDRYIFNQDKKKQRFPFVSLINGFSNADVVLILNNSNYFKNIELDNLISKVNKPCLLFDGWQIFNVNELKRNPNVIYKSVGMY